MIPNRENSIRALYKNHIRLIGVVILTIILAIFILLIINLNRNYKDSNLVNILGKQRMLTQIMAKDTGRIYEINSILDANTYDKGNEASLRDKLSKTMEDLKASRNEYEKQYNTIKNGFVVVNNSRITFSGALKGLNPTIEAHDKIWQSFKNAIDVIVSEDGNMQGVIQAIKYINENNDTLLNYSNDITNTVLNYNNSMSQRIYYFIILLAILLLTFLSVFIQNAYKDLFVPVSQLYRGMSEFGVDLDDTLYEDEIERKDTPVFAEINTVFNELNSLFLVIENLNKNVSFGDTLNYIFKSFSQYIPYTYIGVALIDEDRKLIKACYGIAGDYHKNLPGRLRGLKFPICRTSLAKIIESGEERIINDLEEYVKRDQVKGEPVKEYNKMLLEEGIRSSITFPLKNNNEVVGIIFFSSKDKNIYQKEHIKFLRTLANSITLSLEKDILMEDMIVSSTLALANLTEERDTETGEHLHRMKIYARMLAEFLAKEDKYKDIIDIDYINRLERFAPLHDIGKVAIRDEILLKPGKLTPEEFEIMKTHALYGAKVLKMADENLKKHGKGMFGMAVEIAEGHHEKWDGTGYPYGKNREEIPLSARIVALADVFDALTCKRPYKEPFSLEKATDIILEGSGKHFDPEIVRVFNENFEFIKETYLDFKTRNILA